MTDRIREIADISDVMTRRRLYRKLDSEIGKGEKLSPEEVNSSVNQILKEPLADMRGTLWRIVMQQPCAPRLVRQFELWLPDTSKPDRHMALRFVRECRPDGCVDQGQNFIRDQDASLRYEAALCLLERQPAESLATIVDLFSDLPLHLQEEAEMYLRERGGPAELGRVLLNAKLRGRGTAYDRLARILGQRSPVS